MVIPKPQEVPANSPHDIDDVPDVVTDGGILIFADDLAANFTFQATIVPGPATGVLLLAGLAAMFANARRKP